jgi:hypothetical protein
MTTIETKIEEQDFDTATTVPHGARSVPIFVTVSDAGVTVEARDAEGAGFDIANLLVELYKGQLRLLVWDGTGDGDPTHRIVLLDDAVARIRETFGVDPDEGDEEDEDDEDDD